LRTQMEQEQAQIKAEAASLASTLRAEISSLESNAQAITDDLDARSSEYAARLESMVAKDYHERVLKDTVEREKSILADALALAKETSNAKIDKLERKKKVEIKVVTSQFELKQASTLRTLDKHLELVESMRDQLRERDKQNVELNKEKNSLQTALEARTHALGNADMLLASRERHFASAFAATTIQRVYRKSKNTQTSKILGRSLMKLIVAEKKRAAVAEQTLARELDSLKTTLEEEQAQAQASQHAMETERASIVRERECALTEVGSLNVALASVREKHEKLAACSLEEKDALRAEVNGSRSEFATQKSAHSAFVAALETQHATAIL
jgi:hypothetical protein